MSLCRSVSVLSRGETISKLLLSIIYTFFWACISYKRWLIQYLYQVYGRIVRHDSSRFESNRSHPCILLFLFTSHHLPAFVRLIVCDISLGIETGRTNVQFVYICSLDPCGSFFLNSRRQNFRFSCLCLPRLPILAKENYFNSITSPLPRNALSRLPPRTHSIRFYITDQVKQNHMS